MNYKIEEIEGIGPAYAKKLAAAGITNTKQLLDKCCDRKGRKAICEECDVSDKLILKWTNLADLMRVSGIGKQYSELLEAAGVDTIKELRNRNAANLAAKMKEVNADKKLTRSTPSESMVTRWVEAAKNTEPMLTY